VCYCVLLLGVNCCRFSTNEKIQWVGFIAKHINICYELSKGGRSFMTDASIFQHALRTDFMERIFLCDRKMALL
jgi:hypothetical protein